MHDRTTSPRSALVHAWGSPAIVLTCGVRRPAGYSPSSSATTAVDGVRWFQQIEPKVVVWTAIRSSRGGVIYVSLTVPTSYPAADGYLVDLARPLKVALP